ncbi:MAG: hypothetical protein ACP5VR_01200 [Acidimicrobiales bacterium]
MAANATTGALRHLRDGDTDGRGRVPAEAKVAVVPKARTGHGAATTAELSPGELQAEPRSGPAAAGPGVVPRVSRRRPRKASRGRSGAGPAIFKQRLLPYLLLLPQLLVVITFFIWPTMKAVIEAF